MGKARSSAQNMDGTWLALGAIGALALGGAKKHGSRAKYDFESWARPDERFLAFMPRMSFYAWSDRGDRTQYATPNYTTAASWAAEARKAGRSRVDTMISPSRKTDISGIQWLLPNGDIAHDLALKMVEPSEGIVLVPARVAVRRTLAGLALYQPNDRDFLRVPISMLDDDVRRRMETIYKRESAIVVDLNHRGGRRELGHRKAVKDMLGDICKLRSEGWFDEIETEQLAVLNELAWLQGHDGHRRERGDR
jgi:hypothetical protein